MADGVRIRPADDRVVPDSAMIVLRDHARPFPAPKDWSGLERLVKGPNDRTPAEVAQPACNVCTPGDILARINARQLPNSAGIQHFVKTYHIQLEAGTAIVSTTIWDKLQEMPDNGGFVYVNHVAEPPTQHITPGEATKTLHKVPQPLPWDVTPSNGDGPTT